MVALFHDIGDAISLENHALVSAEALRPYISDSSYWLVQHHGIVQTECYFDLIGAESRPAKEIVRHPNYRITKQFCDEWDQASFDPNYETYPLEHFIPQIKEFFLDCRLTEEEIFNLHTGAENNRIAG